MSELTEVKARITATEVNMTEAKANDNEALFIMYGTNLAAEKLLLAAEKNRLADEINHLATEFNLRCLAKLCLEILLQSQKAQIFNAYFIFCIYHIVFLNCP